MIVEIDGETHITEGDADRDRILAARGFQTIRFTNGDVMTNMDGVLTAILQTLENKPDRWSGAPDSPTPTHAATLRLVPGGTSQRLHPEGEGLES